MMTILSTAKKLELPDWWICAGFVRSKIWDTLHHFKSRTPLADVDVVYFDETNKYEAEEKRFEQKLAEWLPGVPWSVKNEARMHVVNGVSAYISTEDAISKFPETATSLGVKLDQNNNLLLTAPWGIEDVLNLEVKPTPFFIESSELAKIYDERVIRKNWQSVWDKVRVFPVNGKSNL
ncbi:nucleotidyltransferase family protein [Oceanobacillus kapialis]|uniref:nucleotidyltransferase family protein n=1 Tax=Oceanobacillus kapialis TaxID=481353 RepID=UPI00384F7797